MVDESGRIFSPPKIPSIWLDRAIKQQFSQDGMRYDSLAHMRKAGELGPGWLYKLEGKVYYSPNCNRPNVKEPPAHRTANDNAPHVSTHDRMLERYRHPQWWTKHLGYLAFVPVRPDFAAPPLHPLLCLPEVLDDAEVGPHPDPSRWALWQSLQDAVTEASHVLLKDSGAPAVRSVAYPCARVDRNVERKAYTTNKARLHRDIACTRWSFEIWFGCLSYAIAVNEAIINQVNAFSAASRYFTPLSWIELLLVPYQTYLGDEKKAGRMPHSVNPNHPHLVTHFNLQAHTQGVPPRSPMESSTPRPPPGIIDPIFVSSLRNTCISNFDGSVERVGVFVKIPDKPEAIVSIDWLVECRVPVWYAWGEREEGIVLQYPALARYRPPAEAVWVAQPQHQLTLGPPSVVHPDYAPFEALGWMVGSLSDVEISSAKPKLAPFERRPELRVSERIWEAFFASARSTELLLMQSETPEMKQEREVRRRHPPITRPETKFYVWDQGMRGTFRRRIATDEELEALFQEKGQFGKKQARYNSFFNEWDLCRHWGPPDEAQLLYRSKVRADLRGTTVEEELVWWRIYYGLHPLPLDHDDSRSAQVPETHQQSHWDAVEQWNADDVTVHGHDDRTLGMEVGEIQDPIAAIETELSSIARHAYHFLGFTLPLSLSGPPVDLKTEAPSYAPRLVGVPKGQTGQATSGFWRSVEGQAIIRFAKSMASKDPPEPSTWDLHPWNAMPVATLPTFKRLKSFQGQVVIQLEEWDNVMGRLSPKLVSRKETAYWLDTSSEGQTPSSWFIGSETPELALALCRVGTSDCRLLEPLSMAWYLATRGVPFRTWFKRDVEQIQPLAATRKSPQLIQFRLGSQYTFTEKDYHEYVRCRRLLLDGPAGRAAIRAGGIIWRLATNDIGTQDALSGEPSQEALCGQRCVRRDDEGGFLVDDGLYQDEVMAICGEYEVGAGDGNQRGRKSWWPPPDIWEECHGSNGWSSIAEAFYHSRMAQIEKAFTPMSRADWRKVLHPSGALKRAREKVRVQSAEVLKKV